MRTSAWLQPRSGRWKGKWPLSLACLLGITGLSPAASLPVPNGSFEEPKTAFVDLRVPHWSKNPKPDWYDERQGPWDQLIGVFKNVEPSATGHFPNVDGDQALFLFAVPEVGLFQEGDAPETDPVPNWPALYEMNAAYRLTVGVHSGGGGMKPGVSLLVSLYYLATDGSRPTLASTTIVHDGPPPIRQFTDHHLQIPPVQPEDPWAGRPVGIRIQSTVSAELSGGYWDIDNVRLWVDRAPVLRHLEISEGRIQFVWDGEPGRAFEVLSSPELSRPLTEWTPLARLTNETGEITFSEEVSATGLRLYRTRLQP